MKRIISTVLALVMMLSLAVTAYAAEDLLLEGFDSTFDAENLMGFNTQLDYGMPIYSTISESTEDGEGLKVEWGTQKPNGSYGETGVQQLIASADWSTTTFAQNAENYGYLRFWFANPTKKEVLVMTRLITANTKVHFKAHRATVTPADGSAYTHTYSNDIQDYGFGSWTTINIPAYFEGWIAYPLDTVDRTGLTSSSRPALDSFSSTTNIEFNFYLKERTYTTGYYYVLDNLTLSDSPYGTPVITNPKASFDVSGVSPIEADEAGNVTLPSAEVSGKQFIGWKTEDGTLYKAGQTVNITENTAFSAVATVVELQTGAGIRWAQAEAERGIRFETYVSKAALDALGSSKYELGALVLPYSKYDANITVENATDYGAVNVVDPKVYGQVNENYRYYTGIVDFEKYFEVSQAALADMKITAVSYIRVIYNDGTSAYFYDHPDATNNVRTVAEVARAALADTAAGYTDGQIAILNRYTEYSQEDSVPEYRKEKTDDPDYFNEREYKFLTDITDKSGDGFMQENMNNGDAINDYTPSGYVDLYSHSNFSNGNTLTFTLPENFAAGTYKVSFNTRGSNTNRVDNVKIEVTSSAGSFVVADSQSFFSTGSSAWWLVECPNNVEIEGVPTFKFTSQSESGKISLYDIVLTKVQ